MLHRIIRKTVSRDRRLQNYASNEARILQIARRIMHRQANVEMDRMPLQNALQVDPGALGSVVPMRLVLVINAMRRARTSCFHYSNPYCSCCQGRVTDEERLFLAVFRAVSEGRKSAAHSSAMILCEGGDTRAFLLRMNELAKTVARQAL